jgi:predicted Rossmann-fold nucleotide-binding protein
MQAANEGAMTMNPDNPQGSIGIAINLPFEEAVNSFVGQVYEHKTFFTRLHHFVFLADAFVVMPGGIGTALETMMVWQLLQVRKLYGTPLILVGKMWSDLIAWARLHMVEREPQFADALDMTIPRCVESIDEAIALIREHHAAWQGVSPERE